VTVRVTVDEQDVYPPRVLVTVTGLTIGDFVTVYRVVAGERTAVRQGAAEAVDVAFLVLDAELPFGTPVRYVAVVSSDTDVLGEPGNANPTGRRPAAPRCGRPPRRTKVWPACSSPRTV
jgi:hypothetical protein